MVKNRPQIIEAADHQPISGTNVTDRAKGTSNATVHHRSLLESAHTICHSTMVVPANTTRRKTRATVKFIGVIRCRRKLASRSPGDGYTPRIGVSR